MIRAARLDELEALTTLMHRSKAHWGYDDDFMAAARAVLQLAPRDFDDGRLVVFDDGALRGLCKLTLNGDSADLDKLFVLPAAMGCGVGRTLMTWAIETAINNGAGTLNIEADPDAAPFYDRMGARLIGQVPSEAIKGRMLPLMQIDLSDLAARSDRSI